MHNVVKNNGGLTTKGIFRISSTADAIKELRDCLLTNATDTSLSSYENHTIACTIKALFREIEDPLLTFILYPQWIGIADDTSNIQNIKQLMKMLPETNRKILNVFCHFLHEIRSNVQTRMDSRSLATCIGPPLCRPKIESNDLAILLSDVSRIVCLFSALIEEYTSIFDEDNVESDIYYLMNRGSKKLSNSSKKITIDRESRELYNKLQEKYVRHRKQSNTNISELRKNSDLSTSDFKKRIVKVESVILEGSFLDWDMSDFLDCDDISFEMYLPEEDDNVVVEEPLQRAHSNSNFKQTWDKITKSSSRWILSKAGPKK